MPFNLEMFKANLRYGIAKPNRYKISITPPPAMRGFTGGFSLPDVGLFAEEAQIPGKALATRIMGMHGPAIRFPYQEIYTDLQLTFICSADMGERKFFEWWHNIIVNPKSGYFGYYKSYVTDIGIFQLDEQEDRTYEGVATEAWPVSIDNQQLSYKSQNEYHRLTVTFAYVKYMQTWIHNLASGDSGIISNPPAARPEAPIGPELPPLPEPPDPVAQ